MISAPRIPTYTCQHHSWQSWRHYGCKMDESGCKLKGGLFDCKYHDGAQCPDYVPREKEADHE